MANKTTIKAKSGKEYGYARITRTINGIPRQFTGKTKKEALQKFEKYKKSSALSREKSFGELVSWWNAAIYSQDTSLQDSTKALHINAYHAIFDDAEVLPQRIEQITGADLQAVFSASDKAGTTQRHARSYLKRFYAYMIAQGVCTTDSTLALVLPKAKAKKKDQSIEVFTDEELRLFLDKTPKDHRLRLLVVLAIYSGARIGELLALTYEDLENGQMRINKQLAEIPPIEEEQKTRAEITATKTKTSNRTIPLEPAELINAEVEAQKKWHTAEMLKNGYRTNQIFTTATGELYFKSTVRTAFKRLCKQIEIEPRGFHTFRHTAASRLAKAGTPIETTSKLLGHDSIDVTAKYYVGIDEESKRNALKKLIL